MLTPGPDAVGPNRWALTEEATTDEPATVTTDEPATLRPAHRVCAAKEGGQKGRGATRWTAPADLMLAGWREDCGRVVRECLGGDRDDKRGWRGGQGA